MSGISFKHDGIEDTLRYDGIIKSRSMESDKISITNTTSTTPFKVNQAASLALGEHALWVYSNADQDTDSLGLFQQDNESSTKAALAVEQDGTGFGLLLNMDGDATALSVQSDALSANTFEIDCINTSGTVLDIDLSPGVASSASAMVVINDSFCAGSSQLARFDNEGTYNGLIVNQNGVLASSKYGFEVYSNAALTNSSSRLAGFHIDNSSSTKEAVFIIQDGSGDALFIDNNNSGNAIEIDQDSNSGSNTYAFTINSANAGAGNGYGINIDLDNSAGLAINTNAVVNCASVTPANGYTGTVSVLTALPNVFSNLNFTSGILTSVT